MGNRWLDYSALAITVIGAVNWGLIGFFELDLVAWLFGNLTLVVNVFPSGVVTLTSMTVPS